MTQLGKIHFGPMIPRKRFDIRFSDILFGMGRCLMGADRKTLSESLERSEGTSGKTQLFLSVRSGFDAVLQTLQFPKGSQVLVSAYTIPGMLAILEHHGLIAVPLDLDPQTLCPDQDSLENALCPKTVAIVVTHLFGGRMKLDPAINFAKSRDLFVFEDGAQSYWGDDFSGHPQSDVVMFSFGPIKHNTALGGGTFFFRDKTLCDEVVSLHASYPIQSRSQFLRRLIKYSFLKVLSQPLPYAAFCWTCKLFGTTHEVATHRMTRGFGGKELINKIRRQPCDPLLAMLHRRFNSNALARAMARRKIALFFLAKIQDIEIPGLCDAHSFWLFPIRVEDPKALCRQLWASGFDAHPWPVSMCVVPGVRPHGQDAPQKALALRDQLLFLPVYPDVSKPKLERLATIIRNQLQRHASSKT